MTKHTKTFTDLLDDYLEQKNDFDEARKNFTGYDFYYFNDELVERHNAARDALNDAFQKATGESK
jgi:hypothetical protein